MKIDIVKIREHYRQNDLWEKETRENLKQAIVALLGDKEWHFAPVDYDRDRTDKMAGARVVDGEVQYCSARRGSWMVRREKGVEVERVATWYWCNFKYLHVSWWIKLYEILMAAKDTAKACEPIKERSCVANTYAVPFAGEQESSISI